MSIKRKRYLISFDGEDFFVRRIAYVVTREIDRELVFYCDKHIAGPFRSLRGAVKAAKDKKFCTFTGGRHE